MNAGLVFAGLLALALGLTIYAAIDGRLALVSAAVVATVVTLTWALASPAATLITLGALAACYLLLAWRSPARIATAPLGLLATAALAGAAILAAGQPVWLAGVWAIAIAVVARAIAARLTATLPLTAQATEAAAWVTIALGITLTFASAI